MSVGIVVIGRNEGVRLIKCIKSVICLGCPIIYVDSGSSDDSVSSAAALGVDYLELEASKPFSAARARNEGFDRLMRLRPDVEFVQFLDADCTLLPEWIEAASKTLSENTNCSAVVGELLERNIGVSKYNRLCALEWRTPPRETEDFGRLLGGISMIRSTVFRELGGFRPDVIAGEDTEFGVRMWLAGYLVVKLRRPMATHDANITSFRQWWRRAVRAGHAIGQRYDIHGRSRARDCVRERRSTLFWGIALPVFVVLTAYLSRGASLLLLLGYPALGLRMWRYRRQLGDSAADAALYAAFGLVAKIANAVGLLRFYSNKLKQRYEIIEYKQ